MKLCFLIPDGVGIRNYLYSDVLTELYAQGHEVVLWHSLDPTLIAQTEQRLGIHLEQYPFEHKADGIAVQLLREAGRFARIRLNAKLQQNPTLLTNWSGAATSIKGKLLKTGARALGSLLTDHQSIAKIESVGHRLLHSSEEFQSARRFLEQIRPDLVFCTHQRVFSVTASLEAAKSLGIPTSTAVFSWDNLPKGRLPFRVDQYLVWSQYMRKELLTYYPEISPDQIRVTGSPQFDFYFQEGLVLSRDEFGEKYGLDLSKKWVCFSGCDTLTSPNDPLYLGDVAEALRANTDFQLLFRPVPVESSKRFETIMERFPEIKLIEPLWVRGSHWGNFFPLIGDIQLLVNLAFHCPVVINMGSTMALDFSTFGNVGLYLRYDHEGVSTLSSVKTIYGFQHFRSMEDWKAVGYIWSPKVILPMIEQAYHQPDQVAPDRAKWFRKIVEPNPGHSSAKRVVAALIDLISPS
jgi:hypothetical protein